MSAYGGGGGPVVRITRRLPMFAVALLAATACAPATPPEPTATTAPDASRAEPARPAPAAKPSAPSKAEATPLPDKLETSRLILVKPGADDTPSSLAAQHLGDARGGGERLDPLDELVARVDVDAGLLVGEAHDAANLA